MHALRGALAAVAVGIALVAPASAGPAAPGMIAQRSVLAAETQIEQVRWRGRGVGIGIGAGIIGGAIIGGALAAPYYNRPYYYYPAPRAYYAPPPPVYYAPPPPPPVVYGADADAYCFSRFRSYDPRTRTYLGYDGYRHPCP